MRSESTVKRNFFYNSSYQVFKILTPIVTTPYLARVLGPENVGTYSYTHSIASYFVLFSILGMSTYGMRLVATRRNNIEDLSKAFWSAYSSQLLVSTIVLLAYIFYSLFIHVGGWLISTLWAMYVISAALDISWLFFGIEEFRLPTVRSFIIKIAELCLIFLLVKTSDDLSLYIAIMSGAFLFGSLCLWPYVGKFTNRYMPKWPEIKVHFIPNIKLFIPVVAISLYTSMDKIMLGIMSARVEVGYYEYAEKICKLPLAVITAMGTVMLPRMSNLISRGRKEEGSRLIDKTVWIMQAGAFLLTMGIITAAKVFVPVFFGPGYESCAPVMCIISAALPAICMSNVLGRQYLLPTFRDRQYTLSVVVGAIANVIANMILIPRFAAVGAALGTVIAEYAVLVTQCVFVSSELSLIRYFQVSISFFLIGLVSSVFATSISLHLGGEPFKELVQLVVFFSLAYGVGSILLLSRNGFVFKARN